MSKHLNFLTTFICCIFNAATHPSDKKLFQNIHGLTNGGFHRNGSLRSTDCRNEGPFHPHGERGPGEGPFHIEDRGDSHHLTLEQPYRGDPLPLYPEMENARGKVNIVIFSGKSSQQLNKACLPPSILGLIAFLDF